MYLDLKEAYLWLKNQKGLLTLVSILSLSNFLWGFTTVLLPPMVLTFSDARGLGIIESTIGLAFSNWFNYFSTFLRTSSRKLKACYTMWTIRWS